MGSPTGSVHADAHPDPETAVLADEAKDAVTAAKKADRWRIMWYLVFATFGGILLAGIIKSFVENGDIEVRAAVVSDICRLTNRRRLHDP